MPACIASTVLLPMTERGRASSILRKPRAAQAEGVDRDLDAGRDRPAQVLAARRDRVEGRRRTEVDHHARAVEQVHGRERVDDAVGPDLLGVVHQHRHAGPDAGLDDDGRHVAVVTAAHVTHLVQHAGHRRAERDAVDLAAQPAAAVAAVEQRVLAHQALDEHGMLIGGAPRIRRDAPVLDDALGVEQTHDGVRVTDVDGQQHLALPRSRVRYGIANIHGRGVTGARPPRASRVVMPSRRRPDPRGTGRPACPRDQPTRAVSVVRFGEASRVAGSTTLMFSGEAACVGTMTTSPRVVLSPATGADRSATVRPMPVTRFCRVDVDDARFERPGPRRRPPARS